MGNRALLGRFRPGRAVAGLVRPRRRKAPRAGARGACSWLRTDICWALPRPHLHPGPILHLGCGGVVEAGGEAAG